MVLVDLMIRVLVRYKCSRMYRKRYRTRKLHNAQNRLYVFVYAARLRLSIISEIIRNPYCSIMHTRFQ